MNQSLNAESYCVAVLPIFCGAKGFTVAMSRGENDVELIWGNNDPSDELVTSVTASRVLSEASSDLTPQTQCIGKRVRVASIKSCDRPVYVHAVILPNTSFDREQFCLRPLAVLAYMSSNLEEHGDEYSDFTVDVLLNPGVSQMLNSLRACHPLSLETPKFAKNLKQLAAQYKIDYSPLAESYWANTLREHRLFEGEAKPAKKTKVNKSKASSSSTDDKRTNQYTYLDE